MSFACGGPEVRPGRRWLMLLIGAGSMLSGMALMFRLVTPERVGGVSTVELLGLVAMLALPPLTAWLGFFARRGMARRGAMPLASDSGSCPEAPAMETKLGTEQAPHRPRVIARADSDPAPLRIAA